MERRRERIGNSKKWKEGVVTAFYPDDDDDGREGFEQWRLKARKKKKS